MTPMRHDRHETLIQERKFGVPSFTPMRNTVLKHLLNPVVTVVISRVIHMTEKIG